MRALLMAALTLLPQEAEVRRKIVVFAREGNDWNSMVASAWEFDPAQPEAGLVRRAEFAKSHWSATPLFMFERAGVPEYVRLQVNGRTSNGYTVNLYHINYRTWKVDLVLQTVQAFGQAFNDRHVFLRTDRGFQTIDRATRKAEPLKPAFELVTDCGNTWLVELPPVEGKPSGALFDVSSETLLEARFPVPQVWKQHSYWLSISPDRRRIVAWDRYFGDDPASDDLPTKGPLVLTQPLQVFDLASGKSQSIPFRARCQAGSGEAVLSLSPELEWKENGAKLAFSTCVDTDLKSKRERITVDAKSLEIVSREAAAEPTYRRISPVMIPEYLKADYESLAETTEEEGRRVAAAFLKHHRIDVSGLRDYPDMRVKFSPDGKRVLLKISKTGGGWYFGDLAADKLQRVATPPALDNVALDLYWVPVPKE